MDRGPSVEDGSTAAGGACRPARPVRTEPAMTFDRALLRRLFFFALAGGSGFVTDVGVLTALHDGLGVDPYSARVVAIGAAMLVTYVINRTVTFGASGRSVAGEGARYVAVAVAVAAVNWAIYATLVWAFPALPPQGAVVVAVAVATGLSYFGYSRLVFTPKG